MTASPDSQLFVESEWVRYQLGALGLDNLHEVGLRLLMAGPADSDLATLAALPATGSGALAREAFDRFGRSNDLPFVIDPARRLELAKMAARAITDGRIETEEGVRMLRRLCTRKDDTGRYITDANLLAISSYATLLDEYPDQRTETLTSATNELRSFLAGSS